MQVVAQGEDPAGVSAQVPADAGALPEHVLGGAILHVEQATAVTQAHRHGTRGFLTGDVASGSAIVFEHPLECATGGLYRDAERIGYAFDQFLCRIGRSRCGTRADLGLIRGAGSRLRGRATCGDGGGAERQSGSYEGAAIHDRSPDRISSPELFTIIVSAASIKDRLTTPHARQALFPCSGQTC